MLVGRGADIALLSRVATRFDNQSDIEYAFECLVKPRVSLFVNQFNNSLLLLLLLLILLDSIISPFFNPCECLCVLFLTPSLVCC